MTISTQLLSTLAPRGHIRASINTGNPILARLDGDGRLFAVILPPDKGLRQMHVDDPGIVGVA